MAYVDDSLLKDDQQNQNQQGGPTVAGSSVGGSVAPAAGAGGANPAQPKTTGNFADLSEYLRVNQPQQFGQQVAGKIGQDISNAQNTLDNSQGEFKNRVDASTVKDTTGVIPKVSQNPTAVDPNAFGALRDATYKGPKSLSDSKDLYNQVEGTAGAAAGKAKASDTEGGRFALLDSYFNKPNYSQGQKSLDNLLIQNDPNSRQAFDQMRTNASTLQQNVGNAERSLGEYGAQGAQTTANTRGAARAAVGIDQNGAETGTGAIGDLQNSIKNRTTSEQTRLDKEYTDAQGLSGNKYGLSPEFLKAMGVTGTPANLGQGYGVDASKYLTGQSALTNENVATPEEAQRLKALEQLGGQSTPFLANGDYGTSANEKGFNFDANTYGQNVTTQKAAYDNASKTADAKVTDLQNKLKQAQVTGGQEYLKQLGYGDTSQLQAALNQAQVDRQNIEHQYMGTMGAINFDRTTGSRLG